MYPLDVVATRTSGCVLGARNPWQPDSFSGGGIACPKLPADAPESKKDKLIEYQSKMIQQLEIIVKGHEENLSEPLRAIKEDVEKEWILKLEGETKMKEEKEAWANKLARELEKEKRLRVKLEEEQCTLAAFVSKSDLLGLSFGGLSLAVKSMAKPPMPSPGGTYDNSLSAN